MIEVQNLIKNYSTGKVVTKVLQNLTFSIPSGEMVAIIGKSGAGKSTLLYQLSLLDTPTSGSITINNIDTATLSEKDRVAIRLSQMGYVFQDYSLVPELTAQENVMLPLMMQGITKKEAAQRAHTALTRVGLEKRLNYLPSQLSGGEKQRAGIARAVINNPEIIFADEPTASLDSTNSQEVMNVLTDLHKKGQTIVMVTHETEYANMCQRILELEDGYIIKDTRPNQ